MLSKIEAVSNLKKRYHAMHTVNLRRLQKTDCRPYLNMYSIFRHSKNETLSLNDCVCWRRPYERQVADDNHKATTLWLH
jgi:hypothetical protein